MAKLTFDEFKSVLDYIEQRQPDSYSSLYLYVKEYTDKATVFKHPITDEEVRSIVDAIVIQESVQLVDSDHIYRLPVIRDASWVGSGSKPKDAVNVYDRFIAGYTNAEDIMNTICRAYGVILDESFKFEAPDDYNKILRLIAEFYNNAEDVANQPFGAKKYGEEYLSYFPVYIIYEVGKYLSDLGLFTVYDENMQPIFQFYKKYRTDELFNSSEFKYNVFDKQVSYISTKYPDYTISSYNDMYNLVSGLVDFSKFVLLGVDSRRLVFIELPNNVYFLPFNSNLSNKLSVNDIPSFSTNSYYLYAYCDDDFEYTSYIVDYRNGSVTYSKSVSSVSAKTVTNISVVGFIGLTNINYLNQVLPYSYDTRYLLSLGTIPGRGGYSDFFNNCVFDELSVIPIQNMSSVLLYGSRELTKIVNSYSIPDKSLCFYIQLVNKSVGSTPEFIENINTYLIVLSNLSVFSSRLSNNSDRKLVPFNLTSDSVLFNYNYKTYKVGDRYTAGTISISAMSNSASYFNTIYSNSNFNVSVIKLGSDGELSLLKSIETNSFDLVIDDPDLTKSYYDAYITSNVGKLVIPKPKPEWYELESGAILPNVIGSIQDLTATYPSWMAKQVRIHTPYYEGSLDEEVLTGLATVDFVPLSVSGANSQSEAQAGIIDVDNFDIILEQIEEAEEDISPEEDPDKDPNDDPPHTNIGNTPDLPDISNLPNYADLGLLHMYKLNRGQLKEFAAYLIDPLSTFEKFFNNPFEAIISLQASVLDMSTGLEVPMLFNGHTFAECTGTEITNSNVEGDFGTISLEPYFNNYTDYTDTELELYLPFVGYVSLDVDKFINGDITVKFRADVLTGSIVYYVYSLRDGTTQLLYSFDGNCNSQIPVTSSDYTRVFSSIFGVAGAAAGFATGIPAMGAAITNIATGNTNTNTVSANEVNPEETALKALRKAVNNRTLMERAEKKGLIDENWDLGSYM